MVDLKMQSYFEIEQCFGEVTETTLNSVTGVVWPQKKAHFGNIVLIHDEACPMVGIIIALWQETLDCARQIVPLQLSPIAIKATYPHLATLIASRAKIAIIGKYDPKTDQYLLILPNTCVNLHAWIKEEPNANISILNILEKIAGESLEQSVKENLFLTIVPQLLAKEPIISQTISDRIYQLAEQIFAGNFTKIATFFSMLETSFAQKIPFLR